jgi:DNA-binding NarL/FixJ family response regulator
MAEAIDEIWRWLTTLPALGTHVGPRPRLTRRELEVLGLLTAGLSDQAIADRIFISRRTVSRHVSSILAKLKLESRTAAAVLAVREGLIPT